MKEFINQTASFVKAMAIQIAAGCPMATEEEHNRRKEICNQCEFLIKKDYRCGVCKCYLSKKIPLETSKCPKGYWENSNE